METQSLTTQKRTVVACEACRKRKRKCNGARPCSLCQTHNKECHYELTTNVAHKRKRDHEYVSTLEEQLEALKAYVKDLEQQNQKSSKDFSHFPEEQPDGSDQDAAWQPGADSAQRFQDHRLTSAVDEVGSMMWKMSIGETGTASFIGPSGNFCFSTSAPIKGPATITGDKLDTGHLLTVYSGDERLCSELLQAFVEYINPFHQFILSPSFISKPFDDDDMESAFLQSAILAAGSRLSSRPDADQIGDCFASNAERLALKCCRDHPSLIAIQALTIMCWRELSLENENMAWMYNSMAGSLCIHLGLHAGALEYLNSEIRSEGSSFDEKSDSRIRTFWQFFLVDRIATSILGRQCSIPWKRVKTLPFQSTLNESSLLHEVVFDHQCRLWLLHDQFMDQIYSFEFPALSFAEKNRLLMDARERVLSFHQAIDDRLRFGKILDSEYVACFQMSYQMSLILIHRPYLREAPESGSHRLALRSMTAAATTMTSLIRAYRKLDTFTRAPFHIVHHILTAAIIHLLGATSSQSTLRHQSISRFRVCVEALEQLQPTWHRAHKSIALLQELASRWSVVFALPMRLSNVLSIADPVVESAESIPKNSEPLSHLGNIFEGVHSADSYGFERQESILDSGLEDAEFAQGISDHDFWMDPSTFDSFAMQDEQFAGIGLDWLFASQP